MDKETLRQKLALESDPKTGQNLILDKMSKSIIKSKGPVSKGLESLLTAFSEMQVHEKHSRDDDYNFLESCAGYYSSCLKKIIGLEYTLDDAIRMCEEFNTNSGNAGGFGIFTSAAMYIATLINRTDRITIKPKGEPVSHFMAFFGTDIHYHNKDGKALFHKVHKDMSIIVEGNVGDYAFLVMNVGNAEIRGYAGNYLGAFSMSKRISAKSAGLNTGLYSDSDIYLDKPPVSLAKDPTPPYLTGGVYLNGKKINKWKTLGFYQNVFSKFKFHRLKNYMNAAFVAAGGAMQAGAYLLPQQHWLQGMGFIWQIGLIWIAIDNAPFLAKKVLDRALQRKIVRYAKNLGSTEYINIY